MTHDLAGARGSVADRDAVLRTAQEWAGSRGVDVCLADASIVFGRDHLESAAFHAERAWATRTAATRSISMEALLYLSGRRQVTQAIEAAGLHDGTTAIAIIVFGDSPVAEVITQLGWTRDDSVLGPEAKSLRALGLTSKAERTVSGGRAADLALERTALVDLVK